jgi:hypothetical protein
MSTAKLSHHALDGLYTVYENSDIPVRQPDVELLAHSARDVSTIRGTFSSA